MFGTEGVCVIQLLFLSNDILTKLVFPQSQPGRALHNIMAGGETMLQAEVKVTNSLYQFLHRCNFKYVFRNCYETIIII